jgi:hypothetical protein
MISTTATDIQEQRTSDLPEYIKEIKDSLEVKDQKENTVDRAMDTENDTKLYEDINKDSENLDIHQRICESSKGAQHATTEQEPNASDNLTSAGKA